MIEKEKLVCLVRTVQQQKDGAAGELYEVFYDDIYYHILKSVDKDPELAADLTQDTFIEILETIDKLQEPAAFVTWSKQIAYHKCTAYFRKRRELLLDEQEDGYSAFDAIEEDRAEFIPGEGLDKEDFKQTIHAMIQELPMEQRTALMMRYFNEYSVKDIAQIQGVTEGTVKSRLNYARKAVKQAVENYEKKNGIRLHCVGVLPMLLWFFRAYRRVNGMVITSGTASAVYGAASATTGTAAAAVAATATEKTGLAATLSAISKSVAAKVVAAVAAVGVAVGGIAAVVSKPEPAPEIWTGYVQEYRIDYSSTESEESFSPKPMEIPLENSRMYFELELQEMTDTQIFGNLRITWEDGEVYQSQCVVQEKQENSKWMFFSLEIDPLYLRTVAPEIPDDILFNNLLAEWEDNVTFYLGLMYDKETDTLAVTKDSHLLNTVYGELTRESEEASLLCQLEINSSFSSIQPEKPYLFYTKETDDASAWKSMKNHERNDLATMNDPATDELWGMEFCRKQDDSFVWARVETNFSQHIVIPEEVGGYSVSGLSPLYNIYSYTEITLPSSLTVISDYAFPFCDALQSLEIPESVREIGRRFVRYGNQLDAVEIPEGVEKVGGQPFMSCANLRAISFPSTMTELGGCAAYNCPKLESITVVPGNPVYHSIDNCMIETASKTLISGCKTSVIPADGSVTKIGRYSFAANAALTEIVIPEGVKEIEYCAFVKCSNLSSIFLPESMETIDNQAFKFCENLSDIYYAGTMESFGKIQGIHWDADYQDFHITVHCSDGELTIG